MLHLWNEFIPRQGWTINELAYGISTNVEVLMTVTPSRNVSVVTRYKGDDSVFRVSFRIDAVPKEKATSPNLAPRPIL